MPTLFVYISSQLVQCYWIRM